MTQVTINNLDINITQLTRITIPHSLFIIFQSYDPSFGRKRKVAETFEVDTEEIRRVKLTDIESDYQLGCDDDTVIVEDGESLDGQFMYILDRGVLNHFVNPRLGTAQGLK